MFSCCFGGGASSNNQGNNREPRRDPAAGGESIINVYTPEVNPGVPVSVQHAKFLAMLDAMEEANHPPPGPDTFSKQQIMNTPNTNANMNTGMGGSRKVGNAFNNHSQSTASLRSIQRDGSRGSMSPMALSASKTSLKSHHKNSAKSSPKASITLTRQPERNHVYISPEAPS
ncbi:hypothetical protein SARC_12857 [Sphaeroforma arctica JP610]|uniref:Uncharacterized protein n=1 Tax=Sphaeroforma arctica JP610 TaxID=667725 RepID=A0A0L0FDS6_9EUKA|nr:hypothetical protein SARC_12857 [Sphaeroforma arctica JP610]KNC74601.1 hypothetical protein SARC_12857 [Sphaeroforma arctica JP610]|eukprot:XP_014148503.1 hypothetical protein SARC_12857 [Sphaeroforma arctica JP610]